jgi:DNA-binding NarL/FixJ family response regulator
MKVFLVEDAPAVRSRLAEMLARIEGVELAGSATGVQDAIDGASRTYPDAMLLDLRLVDGSGLEVLAATRSRLPRMRVIVLTNFATAQHRQACLDAGAVAFFDKSAEFGRVSELLEEWARTAAAQSHDNDNTSWRNG